jgi:hypothetical protein
MRDKFEISVGLGGGMGREDGGYFVMRLVVWAFGWAGYCIPLGEGNSAAGESKEKSRHFSPPH